MLFCELVPRLLYVESFAHTTLARIVVRKANAGILRRFANVFLIGGRNLAAALNQGGVRIKEKLVTYSVPPSRLLTPINTTIPACLAVLAMESVTGDCNTNGSNVVFHILVFAV